MSTRAWSSQPRCAASCPRVRRQRCTVHLQRNVLTSKLPHRLRKRVASRGCRRLPRPPGSLSRRSAWPRSRRAGTRSSPRQSTCAERPFTSATQFYAFPEPHWARLRTTNSLERLHTEIKRRILERPAPSPTEVSALRLITAVALRTTAVWSERRYLDLTLLEPKEVAKAA